MSTPAIENLLNELALEREWAKAQCVCLSCLQPFSAANVYSEAGWRETRTSGMCEDCWDKLFEEAED